MSDRINYKLLNKNNKVFFANLLIGRKIGCFFGCWFDSHSPLSLCRFLYLIDDLELGFNLLVALKTSLSCFYRRLAIAL